MTHLPILMLLSALMAAPPAKPVSEETADTASRNKPVFIQLKAPPAPSEEDKAILAAQGWLQALGIRLTAEHVKTVKVLDLQKDGTVNGFSARELFSNDNLKHLKALSGLETLLLPPWTDDAGLANVAGLTNLHTLALRNAAITDAGLGSLVKLGNLRKLVLIGTLVSGTGLAHLTTLTSLEMLNLNGVPVTDEDMKIIAQIRNLKMLYLAGAQLTDASVPLILRLPYLEQLDLTGVPISAAGRAKIQRTLPNLRMD